VNIYLMEVSYLKCNKELNISGRTFSTRTDILHTDYSKVGETNPNSDLFQLYQFHQFTYKYCIFPNFAHDDITPVLIL
jgi:hypothetical protein